MRTRRLSSRLLWAVMLLVQTACYVYVPSMGASPRTGQRTQLALTAEGTSELARFLGPQVAEVEGMLTAIDSSGALSMDVDVIKLRSGLKQPWNGEGSVLFPRPYVVQVRERQLQRRKSVVFAAVLTAGLVTVAVIALNSTFAKGSGSDGGSPPP